MRGAAGSQNAAAATARGEAREERSLTSRIARELKAGTLELPAYNATALRLQRELADPECDIERIAGLIRQDPALAGRTLRMANSAFYGGLSQVDTISRAVVRLGTDRILNLAMSVAGAMAMQSPVALLDEFLQRLWLRSYVSAQACRWLAGASSDDQQAEAAFLAGLLHDLGELFLLKVLEKLVREEQLSLNAELVQEVLDSLHGKTGQALMRAWGLPAQYAEIAREHADTQAEPRGGLLAMVRLSDLALRKAGIGQPAELDLVLAASAEAQLLGLSEIQLAQFEVELDDAVEAAEAFAAMGREPASA